MWGFFDVSTKRKVLYTSINKTNKTNQYNGVWVTRDWAVCIGLPWSAVSCTGWVQCKMSRRLSCYHGGQNEDIKNRWLKIIWKQWVSGMGDHMMCDAWHVPKIKVIRSHCHATCKQWNRHKSLTDVDFHLYHNFLCRQCSALWLQWLSRSLDHTYRKWKYGGNGVAALNWCFAVLVHFWIKNEVNLA